ncbi:MFS transporter [Curvibacter lanceolatus]|uniref:MFS transporter n=1 Tax=Curvibacter lanceolatus TaxID=86182 RepID=UPI0003A68475
MPAPSPPTPQPTHAHPNPAALAGQQRQLWVMLLTLCLGFTLSQAYRTVAAMMAAPLQAEFDLSTGQLGLFAGIFHFAFGALQIFMGISIDLYGIRRTLLLAMPLTVLGSIVSALAPGLGTLLLGQALIGAGCAPAFLVCTVYIARRFPVERFAAVSGLVMGLGGLGLLITGTPLAWLIELSSWRAGFAVLGGGSALAWCCAWVGVREPEAPKVAESTEAHPTESVPQALRSAARLLALPHTWGILALASVTYASFISLRGLWLGPMLLQRHGFSLVQCGNVALAVSVVGLFGPPLFGRLQLEGARRRRWIIGFSTMLALLFGLLAWSPLAWLSVLASLVIGFGCGFIILQYADVRASYPPELTGRALAVYTMAMFLGIALMQWVTGAVAAWAQLHQVETFVAVNSTIMAMLLLGTAAFRGLPAAPAVR